MRNYKTNEIKNIALLGSAGSGKTTLAEAMMFEGGVIDRRGDVSSKNTVSDYHKIEHQYESSIYSTVLYAEFLDKKLNIIDTPGLDDFCGGVITALRASDTAIILINAQHGVEVGTDLTNRYCSKFQKPVIFAINQLDSDKANFETTFDSLKLNHGGNKVVLIQYPINTGEGFDSIIDVLLMKMYKFSGDTGKREVLEIPTSEKERAEELHNTLVEAAAENDEKLMELYFDKGTLNEEEMRKGISAGMVHRELFPVFCLSGKKNIGTKRLMEFVINVAPFPNEVKLSKTEKGEEIPCDSKAPVSLFIFKTSIEEHVGEITYFKVRSGTLTENTDLINSNTQAKERISQLYVIAGKNRTKVSQLEAGDIGATVKLKNTKTNNTLNAHGHDWKYEAIKFPNPKFRTAIKTVKEGDEEKLSEILTRLHGDDPTIIVEYSKELKQIIVSGQGEHHLNILKWQIEKEYKLEIEFIAPKIPYRETITKIAQSTYRHKKQSGGAGQFGEVHIVIEPFHEDLPKPTSYKINGSEMKVNVKGEEVQNLPWGGKLVFYNCIVGGVIDSRFMPAILKGIMEKMEEGPLTGSYARDIRVAVYDGKMHPVDSNEISFKLAGRQAFREAFKNAGPKIMEPIYNIEVRVPSDYMGDVMGDLQTRRALVQGMSSEKGFEVIKARVPLSEMNKYSTSLSSITGGRATFNMEFAEYTQVPGEIQDKLLKAYEEVED